MTNKGKCILLVRVSTQRQDFDEQERQLYDLAIADGYKDNEIIPICEKESGIKLKEYERRGLNRLKEEIAKGEITCVYAWEVSRIGRKKKLIFSITEYLAEKRIQLIIKEPYIKLLNPDGSINDGAETILTLFAQISESEMRNKQARWQRTRKRNAEIGKWNGGKNIKFGYSLDENNFYVVNEDEAKIIRLAYELYTTTPMGQTYLRKELAERGYKLSLDRLQKMLSDIGYTGEPYTTDVYINGKLSKGYKIKYPAIISREIFDKAKKKRNESNVNCYRGQSFYFAKGLLRCPLCGYAYQGYKTSKIYCCLAWKHDNKDINKCFNNITININLLDSLLWHIAKIEYLTEYIYNGGQWLIRLKEEKSVIEEKFVASHAEVKKLSAKLGRIKELYVEGSYDRVEFDEKSAPVKTSISEISNRIVSLKEELNHIDTIIKELEDTDREQRAAAIIQEVEEMTNLQRMQEIVREFIFDVQVMDVDKFVDGLNGKSKMKKIRVNLGGGYWDEYYAYNFSDTYLYWNEDKKLISTDTIKIIRRNLGRG